MLDVLSRNYNNRNPKAAMFEIAVSFKPRGTEELPKEPKNIVIGLYGEEYDYFTLKGVIEELLSKTGITDYDIERVTDDPILHPGRAARITVGGKTLALLGEVHPETAKNFSIGTRCYVAEVSMDVLFENRGAEKVYTPLPKFPAVTRDLAFVCDKSVPVVSLEKKFSLRWVKPLKT